MSELRKTELSAFKHQFRFALLTAAMLCSVPLSKAGETWPELPPVKTFPEMEVSWISQKMKFNGLPMSMQEFTADTSASKLIEKYQRYWRSKYDTDVAMSKNGDAIVLGVRQRDYYYSIQIVPVTKTSSMGNLSVSIAPDALDSSSLTKTSFPLPSSANKLSRIEYNDDGVIAETLTFESRRSVSSIATWYQTRLQEEGWQLQRVTSEFGKQLYFQRNGENAQVNIIGGKGFGKPANIQVNWIRGVL